MTAAKVLRGKSLLIKISDEAGSPSFAHPCMINGARGIEITAETNRVRIPDCADPELVEWVYTEKVSKGAVVNGAGKIHAPDVSYFFDLVDRDTSIACKVELNGLSGANGGGYFLVNLMWTKCGFNGDVGDFAEGAVAAESDGPVTWVDAA